MRHNKFILILIFVMLLTHSCSTPDRDLSWEEQREIYEVPQWFTEAKLGIWAHWGAQTQPRLGGGWYARHMYMQDVGTQQWGAGAYPYHLETYGHPSEIGYKDVLNEWKAENLDTDMLLKYFKKIGAKYFIILANHHDHFDNFDSSYHPWNSVNIGPKRDIVKEFELSSKKFKIPFGVSSHDDRYLRWWLSAFGADTSGPYKDIPYDGHMTIEDGKGKWWEGLDPAALYGLPPEKRTDEWIKSMKENWVMRHTELATKYDIDLLWFDGYGFPYKEYGKEVCTSYYNHRLGRKGKIDGIVAGKFFEEPSTIKDIERGGSNKILPYPWQGTLTFGSWFYKEDRPIRHNARTVTEMLTDMMSKNGNMLLNVELLPDGTIPPDHKLILDDIGDWMKTNEEAIYGSTAWQIYGDNLNSYLKVLEEQNIGEADLEALKKQAQAEHFNERTIESLPYGPEEVRFTVNNGNLYIFVLNPKEGQIGLSSLGLESEQSPGKISSIKMLGSKKKIEFMQNDEKLIIDIPAERPNALTTVLKVSGAIKEL